MVVVLGGVGYRVEMIEVESVVGVRRDGDAVRRGRGRGEVRRVGRLVTPYNQDMDVQT